VHAPDSGCDGDGGVGVVGDLMVRVIWMRVALIGLSVAIAAGAFGAHGLENHVEPHRVEVWNTAVRYQAYAMLALLALAVAPVRLSAVGLWALSLGSLIFSGSLYVLVLLDLGILGAVTPIGGVLMIGGLIGLAWTVQTSDQTV